MVDSAIRKSGKKGILTLSGVLTVNGAEEIKDALFKAITRFKNLELEFGEISAMDFSCLQLLCSAHRTAIHRNRVISLKLPLPAVMEELIVSTGFTRHAGCAAGDNCRCFWVPREQDKNVGIIDKG